MFLNVQVIVIDLKLYWTQCTKTKSIAIANLEKQSAHSTTSFTLFLDEYLEVLIDDCNGEKNTWNK